MSNLKHSIKLETKRQTIMFSDKLGEGMGALMTSYLNQPILNHCFPGASIKQITSHLRNYNFNDTSTTIILCLGSSLNVTKAQVMTIMALTKKGVDKVIVCAFPYSKCMTHKENENAHYLNNLIYKLTFRYKKFLFFDSNRFISNSKLTQYTLYLPYNKKIHIAKLLAYNISDSVINSLTNNSNCIDFHNNTHNHLLVGINLN